MAAKTDRLLSKESVATIDIGDVSAAFPLPVLETELVVNYPINEPDVAVFFKPGTVSALDKTLIVDSKDIGATGVLDAYLDGEALTFNLKNKNFVDDQTGTTWNILGEALEGANGRQIPNANRPWQPLLVRLGRVQPRDADLSGS